MPRPAVPTCRDNKRRRRRKHREDAMKRFRRGMMAALFAVAFAAPAVAQDYHIGALLPNSGPMTQFGQLFSNGADLAADHVNADKLLSKPFKINHEDSQGQPQPA